MDLLSAFIMFCFLTAQAAHKHPSNCCSPFLKLYQYKYTKALPSLWHPQAHGDDPKLESDNARKIPPTVQFSNQGRLYDTERMYRVFDVLTVYGKAANWHAARNSFHDWNDEQPVCCYEQIEKIHKDF